MNTFPNAPFHRQNNFLDVAVLLGGDSSERAVSLASGRRVAGALQACGHQVACFDPAAVDLFGINWTEIDVCFIALHGGAGEDGRIQSHLEALGVPYTGSGPAASHLAISKSASKERFGQHRVPSPPSVTFHASADRNTIAARVAALRWPLVIKPDGQGCSLGVGIARSMDDISARIDDASQYESFLIAEPLIRGREFTVAVIDRTALPILEILHDHEIFDFPIKFGDVPHEYVFPNDQATRQLSSLAVAATEALGTSGLVRVDMMLDRQKRPWILEVNTVPGMTERSLAPLAAQRAGIDMPQLCDRLVRSCILEEAYT